VIIQQLMPKFSKSVSEEIDKRIIEELKLNSRVTFENLAKKDRREHINRLQQD